MKKIRLDPDSLRVESFAADRLDVERGTVHAHSGQSCPHKCTLDEPTCNGPACQTFPLLTCLC